MAGGSARLVSVPVPVPCQPRPAAAAQNGPFSPRQHLAPPWFPPRMQQGSVPGTLGTLWHPGGSPWSPVSFRSPKPGDTGGTATVLVALCPLPVKGPVEGMVALGTQTCPIPVEVLGVPRANMSPESLCVLELLGVPGPTVCPQRHHASLELPHPQSHHMSPEPPHP